MHHVLLASLTALLAVTARPGAPTLAVEDTMSTEVPAVLVSAPRVTLTEILDRVARGEARRDSMLRDQTFTAALRLVRMTRGGGQEVLEETVARVYKKRPNLVRTVTLRHTESKDRNKRANLEVNFRSDMDEEIVNFAFRPAARREFKYRIAGRDIVGRQVIYRIAFEPRSSLDPSLPSGLVWVNTNDFVIVRQEVSFPRSPVPLILKAVDRMVIERQRVGEHWVLRRVLLRAATTFPIPRLGREFDMSILFDQYAVNTGLADSLFATKRRG